MKFEEYICIKELELKYSERTYPVGYKLMLSKETAILHMGHFIPVTEYRQKKIDEILT